MCTSMCRPPGSRWAATWTLIFRLCGFRSLSGHNSPVISYSQHRHPDHRSQWGGIFYTKRASPDAQISLSTTQPWGKAGLTALLVRAPGGLAQNLG